MQRTIPRAAPIGIQRWVEYVFDRPVREPEWWWADGHTDLELTPRREVELITATFERSARLLRRFSSARVNQGLRYLANSACSNHMHALRDLSVPESLRLRALRSFVPLFATTMVQKCSQHLSHLDERGARPLNTTCYMWWDNLPSWGMPENRRMRSFDAEALRVMARILKLPHDACRESALHGLGHWQLHYPRQVAATIDRFLASSRGLRTELRQYADAARNGMVL